MGRLWNNGKAAKMAATVLAAVMMLGCAGCGAKTESAVSMDSAPRAANTASFGTGDMPELAAEEAAEKEVTEDAAVKAWDMTDRKLIKTVSMEVETKEFDKALDSVEREADALGGYIESMETYNGSAYSDYRTTRQASLTIRIPKEALEEFLTTVSGISNVTRSSENVEDVTLTYVDLESHKEALETEQKRLLSLLEQAETVEDIITIESRLSEVRYQLESMESQLRTFDNRIDYSTVYLSVDEVEVFSPAQEENTWSRIRDGFVNSIRNIAEGCKELAIWFLIKLPYFVCIAVIAVLVIKKTKKRRKQTAEQKEIKK